MPDGTPDFISDSLKFGINLGLERITALMDLLGNPQKNLKCVHVAGTNGKGSVCATLGTIMACAGKKVGLFTSPFIERFSERMRILDGREGLSKFENDDTEGEIPDDTLQRLSDVVKNATDKLVGNGMEHPTEFELVTAICFLWFAEEKVDIAILEVGLGGLYDSTNIIEHPVCTVITSIGKDHTDRLGDTVGEIAFQKAGILKPGSPLVLSDPFMSAGNTSEEKSEIKKTIEKSAKELDVPVTVAGDEKSIDSCRADENYNMLFEYSGKTFKTKLLGFHQVLNIETAIEAAKVVGVDEDTIGEGVERTSWKCRMEVLSQKPLVVLDGGHNPQGAQVLSDTLFGLLKNKESAPSHGCYGRQGFGRNFGCVQRIRTGCGILHHNEAGQPEKHGPSRTFAANQTCV